MANQQNELDSYIASFEPPLEVYFFSPKEQEKIEAMKRKIDTTAQYLQAILDNPELGKNLEKDTMAGKIYSIGELANANLILRALEGNGARVDIRRSLVSPTGQIVIMSENCASTLGLIADGYITKSDFEQLVQILRNEQVPEVQIKKLQEAINQNEVIMVQRGAFAALKPFMEEFSVISSVKSSFEQYKKGVEQVKPVAPLPVIPPTHGASLNALKDRLANPAPMPKQAPPASKPLGPRMTPEEIKREINTKEIPNASSPIKPILAPSPQLVQPAPLVQARFTPPPKPAPAMKLVSTPSLGLPSLRDIKVIDDLKKVEPAHLRQGYLPEQAKLIRAKIAYLAGVNKTLPISVVNVFEQSPLFKLYLKVGSAILAQSTHDNKADYKQVIAGMVNNGEDVLSLAEFEVVADLRKDLEQM